MAKEVKLGLSGKWESTVRLVELDSLSQQAQTLGTSEMVSLEISNPNAATSVSFRLSDALLIAKAIEELAVSAGSAVSEKFTVNKWRSVIHVGDRVRNSNPTFMISGVDYNSSDIFFVKRIKNSYMELVAPDGTLHANVSPYSFSVYRS